MNRIVWVVFGGRVLEMSVVEEERRGMDVVEIILLLSQPTFSAFAIVQRSLVTALHSWQRFLLHGKDAAGF